MAGVTSDLEAGNLVPLAMNIHKDISPFISHFTITWQLLINEDTEIHLHFLNYHVWDKTSRVQESMKRIFITPQKR